MSDFFYALSDPDIPFLRYAFIVGLISSVSFGIVGTYIVTRRISYIAAAIAHSILGGIGIALYLQTVFGLTWCHPMLGAVVSALTAAIVIGLVSMYSHDREDTVIGAIWAIGMAVGLLFFAKTPGYANPMSYLFGNILMISKYDVWLVFGLGVFVATLCALFHNKLLAICFDEEFTQLRGVRVKLYYLLLLCITALTIVLLVRIVGIVMVIALLTLPAAVAGNFSTRLWHMMSLAVLFCMVFVASGLWLSYTTNLPSGPTIIVIAGIAYLGVAGRRMLRSQRGGP